MKGKKTQLSTHDDFQTPAPQKIAIIGYGRFGKFWAQRLAKYGLHVLVCDELFKESEIYTQQSTNVSVIPKNQLLLADIIFYCVPISRLQIAIENTKQYIHSNCLVCDTCSVKTMPIKWMLQAFPHNQQILGTHPLFGPDSVTNNKLLDKIILCPANTIPPKYKQILELCNKINISYFELSAEEHDRQAVYSQGITHLVGRMLKKLNLKKEIVVTKGYESLLEIISQTCNDSEQLFFDLQKFNDGSPKMWNDITEALKHIITSLQSNLDNS